MITEILKIKDLSFKYKDSKNNILNNVNFTIKSGQLVALLGNNGAGKSTLISCIDTINKTNTGDIIVSGTNINHLSAIQRAKLVSYVPQSCNVNMLNVYDTIMLGRRAHIHISPTPRDHYFVSQIINKLKLGSIADKPTNKLSGGEFQKVCIARAFVQDSPLMLMDEPSNNLDVRNQKEIFDLLQKHIKSNKIAALCVIHDINLAMKYADTLIFMKNGKIIKAGGKDIVDRKLIELIYDVPARIFIEDDEKYVVI